jgi:multidrug efflux system membrane fusion protein
VPVVAAAALHKDVHVQLRAIGVVEPLATVAVRPQVGGVITIVHFSEGSYVGVGDLLFTIDPRPYEAALQQAEGTLAKDGASTRNAQAEAQRGESLFTQGILSKESYDQLRSSAEALEATVRADRAALERTRLDLEYCTIRSPIGGRTGSLLLHQGNFVKGIDGGPLVVINRTDPIFVSFSIPEQRLPEVRAALLARRLAVDALVTGEESRPLRGELSFLDNAVDRGTGTIRLKATFPNSEKRLWPGQFVNARLTLGTKAGAVVIPSPAVQTGQAGTFVFLIKPDFTVEARTVVVEPGSGEEETVVTQGLQGGEQVVTDGQLRLVPGARVELKPAPGAPSPGGGGQSHEHRRALHSAAHRHHPGHARHPHLRHRRLSAPAHERSAQRGLPDPARDR